MEGSEELEEGGGLMELLGSGGRLCLERDEGNLFCQLTPLSSPPPSSSASFSDSAAATTGMLCFAGAGAVAQKSSDSSLSTLCSSSPHSTTATSSRASKKVEVAGGKKGGGRRTSAAAAATSAASGASKKPRAEASARPGTIKVRKAKLGDRILALQQLVSPFGKTDTASVLHEALSYIQFLHDQVQVLSSPYLQRLPSSTCLHEVEEGGRRGEEPRWSDLRSRGLCLVPVSCTERVAHNRSNGADFWATAMGSGSTTTQQ